MSNVATTTLFLPVLAELVSHLSLSLSLSLSPLLLLLLTGCGTRGESSLLHDSSHCLCLLCLHAPSGHTPQCHGLLLWLPKSLSHGRFPQNLCFYQPCGLAGAVMVWLLSLTHWHIVQVLTGVLMNLVCVGIVTFFLNTTGRLIFHLDSFPSWATNSTSPPLCLHWTSLNSSLTQ